MKQGGKKLFSKVISSAPKSVPSPLEIENSQTKKLSAKIMKSCWLFISKRIFPEPLILSPTFCDIYIKSSFDLL